MKRLESNFLNMVLVLTIITLMAAGALGAVYTLTEEPIRLAKEQKKELAVKSVLPDFTRLAEPETANGLTVLKAYNNDDFLGAAVESEAVGFGGTIKIMVGFDAEGKIVNYSVLEQAETPGLGTKMVDWFKTDKNRQSILHINPSTVNFTVSKDGGDIDAITAATMSSRAFLSAVQSSYQAYNDNPENIDVKSGASTHINVEVTDSTNLAVDAKAMEDSLSQDQKIEKEQPIKKQVVSKKSSNKKRGHKK